MFEAINGMPLDMLAAVACKVMTIAAAGRLRAKPRLRRKAATKAVRRTRSAIGGSGRVIVAGQSWRTVQAATGHSRAKIAKPLKQAASGGPRPRDLRAKEKRARR